MKISFILYSFLFSSLFMFTGCGNDHYSNNLGSQTLSPPQDLSSLPLAAVLPIKYDAVTLNCNLWTRMKGPLFLTDTPGDTVSVDLIKDSTFPKTINLAAKSDIHSLNIQIKLTEIKLQNGGLNDNYGAKYSFINSPTIYGQYSGQTGTAYSKGYIGATFQGDSLSINENIVRNVVAELSQPTGEVFPTVDYVECSIATKIKSLYKDEWKQDAIGNKPTCIIEQPGNLVNCMIRQKL